MWFQPLQPLAERGGHQMAQDHVHVLNLLHAVAGNDDGNIHHAAQLTSLKSRKADGDPSLLAGQDHRPQDVGGIAAAAERDDHIPRLIRLFNCSAKMSS